MFECLKIKNASGAIFTKHLKAKSSSELADLGENRKINKGVSPNFRCKSISQSVLPLKQLLNV